MSVSRGSEKSNEFRRYRQVLAGIYITVIAVGFALLAASVGRQLLFRRQVRVEGPVLSARNPDPKMLLLCNGQVQKLYRDLGNFTRGLLARPTKGRRGGIGSQWEEFSRSWLRRWDEVDARCRFSELADSNMGVAYNRMASVHSDLPAMRLKYQSLVVRFDELQAAELVRMKRALDKSHAALVEQANQPAPPERPR